MATKSGSMMISRHYSERLPRGSRAAAEPMRRRSAEPIIAQLQDATPSSPSSGRAEAKVTKKNSRDKYVAAFARRQVYSLAKQSMNRQDDEHHVLGMQPTSFRDVGQAVTKGVRSVMMRMAVGNVFQGLSGQHHFRELLKELTRSVFQSEDWPFFLRELRRQKTEMKQSSSEGLAPMLGKVEISVRGLDTLERAQDRVPASRQLLNKTVDDMALDPEACLQQVKRSRALVKEHEEALESLRGGLLVLSVIVPLEDDDSGTHKAKDHSEAVALVAMLPDGTDTELRKLLNRAPDSEDVQKKCARELQQLGAASGDAARIVEYLLYQTWRAIADKALEGLATRLEQLLAPLRSLCDATHERLWSEFEEELLAAEKRRSVDTRLSDLDASARDGDEDDDDADDLRQLRSLASELKSKTTSIVSKAESLVKKGKADPRKTARHDGRRAHFDIPVPARRESKKKPPDGLSARGPNRCKTLDLANVAEASAAGDHAGLGSPRRRALSGSRAGVRLSRLGRGATSGAVDRLASHASGGSLERSSSGFAAVTTFPGPDTPPPLPAPGSHPVTPRSDATPPQSPRGPTTPQGPRLSTSNPSRVRSRSNSSEATLNTGTREALEGLEGPWSPSPLPEEDEDDSDWEDEDGEGSGSAAGIGPEVKVSNASPRASVSSWTGVFAGPRPSLPELPPCPPGRWGLRASLAELGEQLRERWGGLEAAVNWLEAQGGGVKAAALRVELGAAGCHRSPGELCILFRALGVTCAEDQELTAEVFDRLEVWESCMDDQDPVLLDQLEVTLRRLQLQRVLLDGMSGVEQLLSWVHVALTAGPDGPAALAAPPLAESLEACQRVLRKRQANKFAEVATSRRGLRVLVGVVTSQLLVPDIRVMAASILGQAVSRRFASLGSHRPEAQRPGSQDACGRPRSQGAAGTAVAPRGGTAEEELEALLGSELWLPLLELLDPDDPRRPAEVSEPLYSSLLRLLRQAHLPTAVAGPRGADVALQVVAGLQRLRAADHSAAEVAPVVQAFELLEDSYELGGPEGRCTAAQVQALAAALGGCHALREKIKPMTPSDLELGFWRSAEGMLQAWEHERRRLLVRWSGDARKPRGMANLEALTRAVSGVAADGYATAWGRAASPRSPLGVRSKGSLASAPASARQPEAPPLGSTAKSQRGSVLPALGAEGGGGGSCGQQPPAASGAVAEEASPMKVVPPEAAPDLSGVEREVYAKLMDFDEGGVERQMVLRLLGRTELSQQLRPTTSTAEPPAKVQPSNMQSTLKSCERRQPRVLWFVEEFVPPTSARRQASARRPQEGTGESLSCKAKAKLLPSLPPTPRRRPGPASARAA